MKKLTKNLVAVGVALTMCLPLVAVATTSLADTGAYAPVKLAADGSLNGIGESFDEIGSASGLQGSEGRSLATIIGAIINGFLGLLGIVLVVIIIYSGYLWMMAQGNAAQVDKAKAMISQAVIGMIILMAAYAISQFVLDAIISGTTGT